MLMSLQHVLFSVFMHFYYFVWTMADIETQNALKSVLDILIVDRSNLLV